MVVLPTIEPRSDPSLLIHFRDVIAGLEVPPMLYYAEEDLLASKNASRIETILEIKHPYVVVIAPTHSPVSHTTQARFAQRGYYPLRVFNNHPTSIQTTLYVRTKPNDDPYQKAKAIFQINSFCDRKCAGCYAILDGKKMSREVFLSHLEKLQPNDLIVLRGGEPTLLPGWYEQFVQPALEKKIRVSIDTDGQFIGKQNYESILQKLSHPLVDLRISFDEVHLNGLPQAEKEKQFEKMSHFATDAKKRGINYGFYSLGMTSHQIKKMIEGTSLQGQFSLFAPLTFYSHIQDEIKLTGVYVDVQGITHNKITG